MNDNPIEPTTAPANDETVKTNAPVTDVNTATEAATAEAQAVEPEAPVADVELVKVKVIAPFYDMDAEIDRATGDKFEVSIDRAEALVRADVAKLVKH